VPANPASCEESGALIARTKTTRPALLLPTWVRLFAWAKYLVVGADAELLFALKRLLPMTTVRLVGRLLEKGPHGQP